MNKKRKLVYDFMSLPNCTQMRILGELGLVGKNNNSIKVAFRRARERGLLDKLRISVAAEKSSRE